MDRQEGSDRAREAECGIRHLDAREYRFILDQIVAAEALCDKGEFERSLEFCDYLLEDLDSWENEDLADLIANVILCSGRCLAGLERFEDELEVYNELVQRFDSLDSFEISALVSEGRFNAAVVTGQLGRTEESIKLYASFIERYQQSTNSSIQSHVASAWYNWAVTLKHSNRPEEALELLDTFVKKYDAVLETPEDSLTLVRALISKMGLELEMGKNSAGIYSGSLGLKRCGEEFVNERLQLHLALATAHFITKDEASGRSHVSEVLGLLPEVSEPWTLMSVVVLLHTMTRNIGVDCVVELIDRSPSAEILSSFVENLRQSPRSLTGIKELAQDMRGDFSHPGRLLN